MMNAKNLATFLLGAAAGAAFLKYNTMTDEEKEELKEKFRAKAEEFKAEAAAATDKAEGYFEELSEKTSEAMKEIMDNTEEFFDNLFAPKSDPETGETKE
jgi:hypothetical protein